MLGCRAIFGSERSAQWRRSPGVRARTLAPDVGLLFGVFLVVGCGSFDLPPDRTGTFESCCGGLGTCVPRGLVPDDYRDELDRDACGEALLCTPSALLTAKAARFDGCHVAATGAEGRCVPGCLASVVSTRGLAQDDCAEGHLCTPCFDPRDGESTGACDVADDPGPSEPPVTLAPCCRGHGQCVPPDWLEAPDRARLGRDSCDASEQLCVPSELVADPEHVNASCSIPPYRSEGRCVLACLPEVSDQLDGLRQHGCPGDHVCAPCFDPLDGEATGACDIGGDPGPSEPPRLFDSCCDGRARCVPLDLVDVAERDRLEQGSCTLAGTACAPVALIDAAAGGPASCRVATTGAEGRCLSDCLPEVASQAERLEQASCTDHERCVPCFDPVDGEATGACGFGDDGPREPPVVFGTCCESLGRCVPGDLVEPDLAERLGSDQCEDASLLCVPGRMVEDEDARFEPCTTTGLGAEGRCLPACLPDVAARAAQLTGEGCAKAELCVPCFDPVDGQATGACDLGQDAPVQPPKVFGDCCEAQGRCVPSGLVDDTLAARLGRDSCEDAGHVCAPSRLVEDAEAVFPTCITAELGAEGRCLPACLPEVMSQAHQLAQDGCPAASLCVPCFDPRDGSATGACNLPNDPGPNMPGKAFAECCEGAGRCVPGTRVDETLRTQVAAADCEPSADASSQLCVPKAAVGDGPFVPRTCRDTTLDVEGRCLPACLPAVQRRSGFLAPHGCDPGELCVPCFDPVTGDGTGACKLGDDPGPVEPKRVLAGCCHGDGTCVPSALVPEAQAAAVGPDVCPPEDPAALVCVPTDGVTDPNYAPATCHASSTGSEGRCLPACLPAVSDQGDRLERAGCQASERCVPCYDPVDGSATGACTFAAGDAGPAEPPVVFASCCSEWGEDLGLCVPEALVPEGGPSPPRDTCERNHACVPRALAASRDAKLPSCASSTTLDGACVPDCMLSAFEGALTLRGTCERGRSCVPCSLFGVLTGVCGE